MAPESGLGRRKAVDVPVPPARKEWRTNFLMTKADLIFGRSDAFQNQFAITVTFTSSFMVSSIIAPKMVQPKGSADCA